jgi:uncharacterized phage-like protein YoqJ
MKLGVLGARTIDDASTVKQVLFELIEERAGITTVLTSGAPGVDTSVRQWAEEVHLDLVVLEPHHKVNRKATFNPSYFFYRNKELVKNSDLLVVFDDGNSSDLTYAIDEAKKIGIPVIVEKPLNEGDFIISSS